MNLFINRRQMVLDIIKGLDQIPELYEHITSTCTKTLMSKNKKISLYGMFLPDNEIEYCVVKYEGSLTANINHADFKYYFDEKDRVILTERYDKHKIRYYIFYFYKEDCVEIIWYQLNMQKINIVAKIQYKDQCIQSFFETLDLPQDVALTEKNFGFIEYTYSYKDHEVELLRESRWMKPSMKLDIRSSVERYKKI